MPIRTKSAVVGRLEFGNEEHIALARNTAVPSTLKKAQTTIKRILDPDMADEQGHDGEWLFECQNCKSACLYLSELYFIDTEKNQRCRQCKYLFSNFSEDDLYRN